MLLAPSLLGRLVFIQFVKRCNAVVAVDHSSLFAEIKTDEIKAVCIQRNRRLHSAARNCYCREVVAEHISVSRTNLEETSEEKLYQRKQVTNMSTSEEVKNAPNRAEKRPQFGNRFLENRDQVFQHNAWDNVTWDAEQLEAAKRKVEENSMEMVDSAKQETYETDADQFWDSFYSQHQNKFFKDRHWLFTEFPELSTNNQEEALFKNKAANTCDTESTLTATSQMSSAASSAFSESDKQSVCNNTDKKKLPEAEIDSVVGDKEMYKDRTSALHGFPGQHASKRFWEVGCGVGNTVFPILQTNVDPQLFVYCCDFSSVAVEIVRQNAEYDTNRCHAFVCDISNPDVVVPFPKESLDVIVMIFVLSAIQPDKYQATIKYLSSFLKPGGQILFRDYGRYDMAQLRFKTGRCLSDNFYVRGDGTRVYFFTQEELRGLFTGAGLLEEQNLIDRRLQVNRGRQLTMYRVWIQCKYRKPQKL